VTEPAARASDPAIEAMGFDAAMAEFQRVVAELETGGQPLEEALALYERGVRGFTESVLDEVLFVPLETGKL